MKSKISYGFTLAFLMSILGMFSECDANKNFPPPFKGFGYRLFTKHPAPGTKGKGEFNFVHLSLPHPQFPVFEPFPDILTPLFPPSIKPVKGDGKGRPGFLLPAGFGNQDDNAVGTPAMSGTKDPTADGDSGSSSAGQDGQGLTPSTGMTDSGASSSSGHGGPDSTKTVGTGSSFGTRLGPGSDSGTTLGGSNNRDFDTPQSGVAEEGNGNEGENPSSDNAVDGGDNAEPESSIPSAPEDGIGNGNGVSPGGDRVPVSSVPETNGPTGVGTNGGAGTGIQIDANAPLCLYKNYTGLAICANDPDYPSVELKAYIQARYSTFVTMYSDVARLDTSSSVDGLSNLHQETYICQSKIGYWKPLRARNTDGLWKIVVNLEQFSQSVRIETCQTLGTPCSMIPPCFPTSCVQKNVYHRLLTFDPWNHFYPFKIDTFKLPSSCSCLIKSPVYEP